MFFFSYPRQIIFFILTLLLLFFNSLPSLALAATANTQQSAAPDELEQAQKKLIELKRELKQLESDVLLPNGTEVALFLAVKAPDLFKLDSVKVMLDEQKVAQHLYTERELSALARGTSQDLYTGSLAEGQHHLLLTFIGKGPDGRPYRKAAELNFEKTSGTQLIQLSIEADENNSQTVFVFHTWP